MADYSAPSPFETSVLRWARFRDAYRQLIEFIESCVGLVFCWTIGGVALVVPLILAFAPAVWASQQPGRSAAASFVTVPLALLFYYVHATIFPVTLHAIREPGPLGIEAALLSQRWPILIRPLAAIWWMFMFALGVFIAMSLEMSTYLTPDELRQAPIPITDATPTHPAVLYVSSLGIVFAGNTFLLLAVSVFTRNERVIRAFWRLRVVIDFVVVAVPSWLIHHHAG